MDHQQRAAIDVLQAELRRLDAALERARDAGFAALGRLDLEIMADIVRFREDVPGMSAAGREIRREIRDGVERQKAPRAAVEAQDFAVLFRAGDPQGASRDDQSAEVGQSAKAGPAEAGPAQVFGIVRARSAAEATAICRAQISAFVGNLAVVTWAWPACDGPGLASDGITAEAIKTVTHVASLLDIEPAVK
jgi:hypothetical protein